MANGRLQRIKAFNPSEISKFDIFDDLLSRAHKERPCNLKRKIAFFICFASIVLSSVVKGKSCSFL